MSVPDIKQAIREGGSEPQAPTASAGAPPRRMKRLRRLGWVYLAAVHAVLAVLLLDPGVLQRTRRFWAHDPSVTDEYQGMIYAQVAICDDMPDRSVVYLGDSRMRRLLIHETVLTGVPEINLSIGGDTTKGLLGRVVRYRHLERASRLLVGTGINDLSHFNDDAVVDYYTRVLTHLARIGPKVTVVAVYPINEKIYEQANATWVTGLKVTNRRVLAVNERIQKACQQFPNVDYVDANASIIGEDGNLRPNFSDDGLHLNDTGNKAWGLALKARLSGA
jgi:lysophospholipase L1-like esterase